MTQSRLTKGVLGIVVAAAVMLPSRTSGQVRHPLLFSEPDPRAPAQVTRGSSASGGSVLRRRTTRADLTVLTAPDDRTALSNRYATSLDLNLFADARFVAQVERVEDLGQGRYAWIGSLVGVPEGRAIFAVVDDVLSGSVTSVDAAYEIRWQPGGVYEIEQIDRASFRRESEPLIPGSAELQANDTPATDDGSTIDLMVAYTAAARAGAGGTSAINSLIALGVAETNQAWSYFMGTRLRLVDTFETTYVETGVSGTDLPNIRASSSVASRRNAVGADLVMLLVDSLSDACGIAYLMTGVSTAFSGNAFSVVDRHCVSPNYSFAHELGHNQGSNHAPEDGATSGAYGYSFGYKNATAGFRTIMAYDCSPSCRRLLSFSSPGIAFNGSALGTGSQDNARSVANTAFTVANFRQAASGSGTPPAAPGGLSTSASGSTVFLSWSAPSSGGTPTSYIIEAGSAPGLTNLANFSTGSTSTSYASGGVGSGTYYVRVRATNSAGTSGASNESTLVVGGAGCTAVPSAPASFALTYNSGGTVSFTWGASACATTYVIEAGSSPGLSNLANSDLGSVATSATFNGVGAGIYYVRLRGRNAYGASAPSNEVTLVVSGGGTPTGTINETFTGTMTGFDPVSCSDSIVVRPCKIITFHVYGSGTLSATLTWPESPDIDISLWRGGGAVAASREVGNMESISTSVSAGDYEYHITYYQGSGNANYTLRVSRPQ